MLRLEENERLTRVGPGTPMGALLRRYWHPVAATVELDEHPVRSVKVLGESLVLFRDRQGRLGLIDDTCPHRRVSFLYGVPEEEGLRCCYHGWMFDRTGQCEEAALKRSSVRYGGSRARPISGTAPPPPFYGMTLVSCEKGDIRQSANGLFIYGEEAKQEIPLPTDETGRDAVVSELYEAVVNGHEPAHGKRWGKGNLEVCLAVLAAARARREVFLAHQTATLD
jgi:nitrite reductase/ring-hydroxylating ferredoxin subunit